MRRRMVVLAAVALAVLGALGGWSVTAAGEEAATKADKKAPDQVRVDLSPYRPQYDTLEFSQDNKYVCVWLRLRSVTGDYNKEPARVVVFDVAGRAVSEAVDAEGFLQGRFADLFPRTSWRTRFAEFIKDAYGWGFSRDFKMGLRFVNPRNPDGTPAAPNYPSTKTWSAELWRLDGEGKRLWASDVEMFQTGGCMESGVVDFFQWQGKEYVLFAFSGQEGYVLSREDGKVVEEFTYGHIETTEEMAANKNKWHLGLDDGDTSLRFSASYLSFDPCRRLLACGGSNGRRVRVVSAVPPHETVFEAHTGESPFNWWRGWWSVRRVEFAGGKYLIADYDCAGRIGLGTLEPTEIFDVETWKVVWSKDSLDIRRVSLSPDGKLIAFIEKGILKIEPFRPSGK